RHRFKPGNLFQPSKGSFVREIGEAKLHRSFIGVSCKLEKMMAKLRFGHPNSIVSTIWPGSYESSLTPYFHPIQATKPISKSTDSIYRWVGLRG
ncbi:hypothetical protein LINPERPRIM_LOCUS6248, partial [Linum perenne]